MGGRKKDYSRLATRFSAILRKTSASGQRARVRSWRMTSNSEVFAETSASRYFSPQCQGSSSRCSSRSTSKTYC